MSTRIRTFRTFSIPSALLVAAAGIACANGCTRPTHVEQYGAMREVLREGRTQSRVALEDVTSRSGAVAVGALAGLGGEITIVDGETWIARSVDGVPEVTGPGTASSDDATLLTASHVDDWIEIPFTEGGGGRKLEDMLARLAEAHGIDASRPFPFVIEARFSTLELHVIAGACPIANPAGEPPWRYSAATPIKGRLVGFHAVNQDGVMTHHGSDVHLHAIVPDEDGTLTGHVDHVDHVVMEPGGLLRLPSSR